VSHICRNLTRADSKWGWADGKVKGTQLACIYLESFSFSSLCIIVYTHGSPHIATGWFGLVLHTKRFGSRFHHWRRHNKTTRVPLSVSFREG
jgi:hypothetical protein